ncbi:MAG TPA: helix-hairpin-helix domain-containing protein, partial [Thermoanaerobaculaceae bacterium]|nr:helix-hairpin-helix domain-containing protein [Thermoanaerobaculaceae bacterium]
MAGTMDSRRRAAAALEEMALLAELTGENPFKVRAYANAARAIARGPGDIEALAARGELTSLPGIGKGIAAIVAEVIGRGEPAQLAVLRAGLPAGLPELVALPGLGPKRARALWHELGIASLGELEYACRENRLV